MMHEFCHHLFELFLAHLAVVDTTERLRSKLLKEIGERVNGFDSVVNNVNLAASLELKIDRIFNDNGLEFDDDGLNRQPVARGSLNDGHIPQTAQRHIERPR